VEQAWSRIAVGALPLQAVALGLGGVMVGEVDRAAVKQIVMPVGGERVIVAIPVGQPAE
jgi:nitroreductase